MLDRINRSMSPTSQSYALSSMSQLGLFANHGGPHASMHYPPLPPTVPAEDMLKVKKELRLKQAEYDKEKAILLQKNEQLEAQLKETTARQQSQVQMYETMINSLKAPEISAPSDMLVAKIQESERLSYEAEIHDLREHRRKLQDDLLDKEREFSRLMNDKDGFIKELQLSVDKVLIDKSQALFQWELERKELQSRIQAAATEKEQSEALIEMKWQSRLAEQQMDTERLKLEHMREMDRIRQECEQSVRDVRAQAEQEKQSLEYRLDRQSHDLKSLHHMVIQQDSATNDTQATTHQHRQQLNKELGHIQAEVDAIRGQYDQTVSELTREKELAEARNAKLQKQLEKLKNAPKQPAQVLIDLPMQIQTTRGSNECEDPEAYAALQRQVKNLKQEVELLQDENTKLSDQVKKARKESQEMQDYAERLEANEKKLRKVLEDQTTIEQEQVVELRRMLNQEKKRAMEQCEVMSMAKEALERENYKQATIINEKEEQIRQMNYDIKSHEKRLYEIQSLFQPQPNVMNMSQTTENQMLMNQRQINPNMHYIAQSQANFSPRQFGTLANNNILQRQGSMNLLTQGVNQSFNQHPVEGGVIYNATQGKIECAHCLQAIDSQEFYEHLQTHQHQSYIGLAGLNLSQDKQHLSMTPQPMDGRMLPPKAPMVQQSPRVVQQQNKLMISNNRSFNCLLKEIDEEEERNLVGSIPQGGLLGREPAAVKMNEEEKSNYICYSEHNSEEAATQLRKSRNSHMNQSQKQAVKQAQSGRKSANSQRSSNKNSTQSKGLKKEKSSANITSEIKDLLDKLVAYQGGTQNQSTSNRPMTQINQVPAPQHSQSVLIPSAASQNEGGKRTLMNTESMVELRSSASSSLAYVPPMSVDPEIELRAPKTQRGTQVNQSQRKQWEIQVMSHDYRPKFGDENVRKPSTFELIDKQEAIPQALSLSSSSHSSEDRATARHTSKDTILTIPGKHHKGRRYHEVNKSDIITPNSPRRYQAYFKDRLIPSQSTALPPKQQIAQLSYQQPHLIKQASKPKVLGQTKENGMTKTSKNHRYSPSNTKSIADESQYNQLSPSPEKQTYKPKLQAVTTQDDSRLFFLNSSNPYSNNMPLQQVQNQLFAPGKQSNMMNQFGTYDSGSVIYGAASDAIFKTHGSGVHSGNGGVQHNIMFGGAGYGFQPNATLSTVKAGAPSNVHNFDGVINCSMDEDGEIRPSQIDEFVEVRTQTMSHAQNHAQQQQQFMDYGSGIGPAHITSSYITIGDDDPFISGKFCDPPSQYKAFKPQSHCPSKIHNQSIPLSKNSDMQYYHNQLGGKNVQ